MHYTKLEHIKNNISLAHFYVDISHYKVGLIVLIDKL